MKKNSRFHNGWHIDSYAVSSTSEATKIFKENILKKGQILNVKHYGNTEMVDYYTQYYCENGVLEIVGGFSSGFRGEGPHGLLQSLLYLGVHLDKAIDFVFSKPDNIQFNKEIKVYPYGEVNSIKKSLRLKRRFYKENNIIFVELSNKNYFYQFDLNKTKKGDYPRSIYNEVDKKAYPIDMEGSTLGYYPKGVLEEVLELENIGLYYYIMRNSYYNSYS